TQIATDAFVQAVANLICPAGKVSPFAIAAAPAGWLNCDGASYLRTDYPTLFAAIGTTFGSADGTHFNVPDLRGRVVAAVDGGANRLGSNPSTGGFSGSATLGTAAGEQAHTQIANEVPAHTHALDGSVLAASGSAVGLQSGNTATIFTQANTGNNTTTGQALNVTQPTLILNYFIKT